MLAIYTDCNTLEKTLQGIMEQNVLHKRVLHRSADVTELFPDLSSISLCNKFLCSSFTELVMLYFLTENTLHLSFCFLKSEGRNGA